MKLINFDFREIKIQIIFFLHCQYQFVESVDGFLNQQFLFHQEKRNLLIFKMCELNIVLGSRSSNE